MLKIQCDPEGARAIMAVCDAALRADGLKVHGAVSVIQQAMKESQKDLDTDDEK